MAVLRELPGGREFELRGPVTLIGRDPTCDIVIDLARASRRHAQVVETSDAYFVEDLASANGTFVNGQRVNGRARLHTGDRIALVGMTLEFHDDKGDFGAPLRTISGAGDLTAAGGASIVSFLDVARGVRVEVGAEAKLRAVLEISRNLGTSLDLEVVLPKILESLFAIFPFADRGFVLLRDPARGQMEPKAVRQRREGQGDGAAISHAVINHVVATGRAVLSTDALTDQRFEPSASLHRLLVRSVMCVPMLTQEGTCLGVIQIDTSDEGHQFRDEDLEVLASASTQAARAVELAWWYQERRELEAAVPIQKSFLPGGRPTVDQLRFFDYYSAARYVGGDYYDYVPLPGNRLAVAVGDVAGKGVSAALLMARLSASVRYCLASEANPADAVRRLSNSMARDCGDDRFVTFLAAVIDLSTFSMTLVNAGHLAPLRRRPGAEPELLGDAIIGLPLAVFDRPYESLAVPLERGDTLVLCTDGVTEARNAAGEFYGLDRLRKAVAGAPEDVESLGQAVLDDVQRFTGGRRQNDDLTIVCVGRR
jgi:serine phosphatase RsbU (regulator of sigma subunit)